MLRNTGNNIPLPEETSAINSELSAELAIENIRILINHPFPVSVAKNTFVIVFLSLEIAATASEVSGTFLSSQ